MAADQSQLVGVAHDPEADAEAKSQAELRESFWRVAERIGERNRDLDPDYVLAVVTEEVEAVRQERYEREQRKAANRR